MWPAASAHYLGEYWILIGLCCPFFIPSIETSQSFIHCHILDIFHAYFIVREGCMHKNQSKAILKAKKNKTKPIYILKKNLKFKIFYTAEAFVFGVRFQLYSFTLARCVCLYVNSEVKITLFIRHIDYDTLYQYNKWASVNFNCDVFVIFYVCVFRWQQHFSNL